MRRLLPALLLLAALLSPTVANAQSCESGAFRQEDMAGIYRSPTMIVTVYPCGGTMVVWRNESGDHGAAYAGRERLPGGGFIAEVVRPDPWVGSLDGTRVIGLKPAEPGWVQVITIAITGEIAVYRLQHTAY